MTAQMERYGEEGGLNDMLAQPWDRLFSGLNDDGAKSIPAPTRPDGRAPSDAKRLPVKDMSLFGRCPESDPFVTVVCSICDCVIMPHAFRRHIQQKHGEDTTPIKSILNAAALKAKTAKKVSYSKKVAKSASSSPPEAVDDDDSSKSARASSDVKRLPVKDMPLFGRCPESDPFVTVVCSICDSVIMPHAFCKHIQQRHGEDPTQVKSILAAAALKAKTAKKVGSCKKVAKSASSSPPELADDEVSSRTDIDFSTNVVCSLCNVAVASHSFRRHVLKLHGDDSSAKPILTSALKIKTAKKPGPTKTPPKSSSSSPPELIEESTNKRSSSKGKKCKSPIPPELEPILPTLKRVVQPPSGPPELMPVEMSKKGSKKKVERKPDKVYDPNKHCGVINDAGKPCLRSILCKVHLVAHKRAVLNRALPYDALTKLLKSQNDEEKRPKTEPVIAAPVVAPTSVLKESQAVSVLTMPMPTETWVESPVIKQEEPPAKRLKTEEEDGQFVLPSDLDALIEATLKDVVENDTLPVIPVVPRPEPLVRWSLDAPQLPPKSCSPPPHIQPDEIPWHSSHPRPLATNTFGCRLIGGLLSKCKKLDAFRKHVQAVWTTPGRGGLSDSSGKLTSFNTTKNSAMIVGKKTSATPAAASKRKRKNSGGSTTTPSSTTSDIFSGLLQRTSQTNTNGVPLRLFQGNMPGQQPTFIQFNLCPSK